MATWTYIENLRILLQPGTQTCSLYANGLNSVQIIVTFDPLDEHQSTMTQTPAVTWGQTGNSSAQIIEYDTAKALAYQGKSGWVYSDTPSDYNVVPNSDYATSPSILGSLQCTAYVACYPGVSQTSLGLRIVTASGNVYYSALSWPNDANNSGSIHTRLSITPLPAIIYDTTNTTLDTNAFTKSGSITQTNYFLSISDQGHFIKRADFSDSQPGPAWFFRGKSDSDGPCWDIYWTLGVPPKDTFVTDANYTAQQINSRGPNVLTFTKLQSDDTDSSLDQLCPYDHIGLTIYDECGNSGAFSLIVKNNDVYDVAVASGYESVDQTTNSGSSDNCALASWMPPSVTH